MSTALTRHMHLDPVKTRRDAMTVNDRSKLRPQEAGDALDAECIVLTRDLAHRILAEGRAQHVEPSGEPADGERRSLRVERGVVSTVKGPRRHLRIVNEPGFTPGPLTAEDLLAQLGRAMDALCEMMESDERPALDRGCPGSFGHPR